MARMGRAEQRAQTRKRVFEAAVTVFRRDGVSAASIEDVATLAGVSRGTFYFHFPTKEAVLLAYMGETEEQIEAAVAGLPAETPFNAFIDRLLDEMASIWEPEPALLPDVASAALRLTATSVSDQQSIRLRALLARRFAAAAERESIRFAMPAEMMSDLFLANMLIGLLAWHANRQMQLRVVLGTLKELFFNGAASTIAPA